MHLKYLDKVKKLGKINPTDREIFYNFGLINYHDVEWVCINTSIQNENFIDKIKLLKSNCFLLNRILSFDEKGQGHKGWKNITNLIIYNLFKNKEDVDFVIVEKENLDISSFVNSKRLIFMEKQEIHTFFSCDFI
jgi:uracil DNA glycosylase